MRPGRRALVELFIPATLLFVVPAPLSAQSVQLSSSSVTFATQLVGTTSSAKNVTLTNTDSTTPLAISGISASRGYVESDTCGSSVPPSGNCTPLMRLAAP